jgi:hypothetical protein
MAKTLQVKADIIADTASYVAGVKRATAATDKFGRATKKTGGKNTFRDIGRSAVAATAGVVSLYGAYSQGKKAVDATSKLAKGTLQLQRVTNMSTKDASRFAAVLQERGIEANKAAVSFTALSKQIVAAQSGTAKASDAFKKLGVSQELIKKGDTQGVLLAAADGLSKMKVGAERTALAAQLFGKSYKDLLPLLLMGSKGISAQTALAGRLGAEFSGRGLRSAKDFIRGQREMKTTTLGLQVALGTALMPALTKGMQAVTKFVLQFREGKGAGGDFKRTLIQIKDALVPVALFLKDHARLVIGMIVAWKVFRASLAAIKLFETVMQSFGTVSQYAAAGRARGAAFGKSVKGGIGGLGKLGTVGLILSGMFAVDQYGPAVDKWQKGLSAKIKAKFPSFRKSGSDLIDAFANALKQGGMPSIGVAIQGARRTAKASKGGFVSDGKALISSMSKGISGAASSVSRAVSGAVAKGKAAVSSAVSWFRNIGSNIANAIASGIRGAAGAVMNAAQDLANALPGWARKVLGINSPSKVFAEIGRNVGQGLVVGMMATLPAVKGAAKAVANAASFGVGDELAVGTAQRNAGMARTRAGKRRTAATLRNAERTQRFNEAKGTLQTFINSLVDKIKSAKLAEIMAPVDKARNKRAADEYKSSSVSLNTQIARAQADAINPKAQERYQREAARLDARIQAARAAGNLEAEDALQSEKDALDARYGPAYLTGLQDQLAQLNENEIERTSEAAATAFAETFRKGFDSALTQLLNGGTVEQFFKRIGQTLGGSGVAPGDTKDISGGAGAAAGTIAPSGWASRFGRYFRGKPKKGADGKAIGYPASVIGAMIGASQAAVYTHRKSAPAGYKIQNRASGGLLTPGALTLVGETGPELIVGGKVNSATRTSRMGAGAAGMNITINAHGAAANDPVLLARELGWQLATR